MNSIPDPVDLFKLKPVVAAKVSEISEATASAPVPAEERVNFHIGNPVQDERLYSAYLRMILGIDIADEKYKAAEPDYIINELGWIPVEKYKLDFLTELIKKSAPYSPRGGFQRTNPHPLIQHFQEWLTNKQQEPLSYDTGEKSGKREIILSSGGVNEALRMFFNAVSIFLANLPANIFLYDVMLPDHLCCFKNIVFRNLPFDETAFIEELKLQLQRDSSRPSFLLLGKITKEETRRILRELSLSFPLFFVELNDAPNHLSVAREAKMMNRVLRIITPAVFSPRYKNLSTVSILGNSNYIKVIETIHFQLKGTPSSTEIELLNYLIKNDRTGNGKTNGKNIIVEGAYERQIARNYNFDLFGRYVKSAENKLYNLIEGTSSRVTGVLDSLAQRHSGYLEKAHQQYNKTGFDSFPAIGGKDLLDELVNNINSDEWIKSLTNSYLSAFLNYHPEYDAHHCLVLSGSSRTALSLIGFHCGITEVVFPDLSWTYEHCFPKVNVIALTENYQVDVDAIIAFVEDKLSGNPSWKDYGAVVLNNPHNATGQIFSEIDLRRLIRWLLERGIFIIDDLSYQNVSPVNGLKIIKTIRQIGIELAHEGYITQEQLDQVITVHSMSKTDSFAGARLSVLEIRNNKIYSRLKNVIGSIEPNIAAIFLAYLFYRNRVESVNAYYHLRNRIFLERSNALLEAIENLPEIRNQFDIKIAPPMGSMYPQMIINKLPAGLSLDWLASGLARQGIGLVPLSAFAHTEKGFDRGRKTFRLTLGGTDGKDALLKKTRRVLIDLNRMIAEEASNYNRKQFVVKPVNIKKHYTVTAGQESWTYIEKKIKENFSLISGSVGLTLPQDEDLKKHLEIAEKVFLPERLSLFRKRFEDRAAVINEIAGIAASDNGKRLSEQLEKEFYKDDLYKRAGMFKSRLYDRTVHPTQMYSIKPEILFEKIIENLIRNKDIPRTLFDRLKSELLKEYFGENVAIISNEEPQELLLDLDAMIYAEEYSNLHSDHSSKTFLSFWGDWDGSNRPSGQGHSLVAGVLIENIIRQVRLIQLVMKFDKSKSDPALLAEIDKLPQNNKRFTQLLQNITSLTHQLEKRYKGILPFNIEPGSIRKFGMKLHLAQDPVTRLWHHNDRLERKMFELRTERRNTLEYYFSLNKQIRKALHSLIPVIHKNILNKELLVEAATYRDLLSRFVVTPRIHQKMITSQDQFAIDTTVHNVNEINEIAGKYGNPGMVLALQVSMTTKPEALISLDRKLRSKRDQILRENKNAELPGIWIIPLYEDQESVKNIPVHLNKIWEYSLQSRRLNQETSARFSEMITEIFVAGSDLSQEIGQAAGMGFFRESKFELANWLASHNLIGQVRMKMGSGEPMQRQGGYYSSAAGKPVFIKSEDSIKRFSAYLEESTKRSTNYAATPLMGVFSSGDLRTWQSNLSERVRYLSVHDFAQLLYHVREFQKFYEAEIVRAGEPFSETRLQFKTRGLQELERLTIGKKDKNFDVFLSIYTDNFRQILYGREEDVVGIHIISYFIGRTIPALRDRPTVRPGQAAGEGIGEKILEKIAGTIPFCKYGSLLRAIAHNQSQTMILGINQLTTGLFRALNAFSQKEFVEGEPGALIADRILPNLPVYEILHTFRTYHNVNLTYLNKLEKAFPPGNSALIALREDIDSFSKYLLLFQQELLRRHGLNVGEFFSEDRFIPDLLPTLRPDIAVLLQPDFFNTSAGKMISGISGSIDNKWLKEMEALLSLPDKVEEWRAKIWNMLEVPVFQRVSGFMELAIALYSLSTTIPAKEFLFSPNKLKISPRIINFSRGSANDNMQQFLAASLEYLSILSQGMVEVPINIIRALKEAETIIKIEEQPLNAKQQELLRYYLLQIARLTGENG